MRGETLIFVWFWHVRSVHSPYINLFLTGILYIRKTHTKIKVSPLTDLQMEKIMLFVIPEMPSKLLLCFKKDFLITLSMHCARLMVTWATTDRVWGGSSPVMLELYDGKLSCDLDGVEGHELRPVIRRVLDPHLYRGRRPDQIVYLIFFCNFFREHY